VPRLNVFHEVGDGDRRLVLVQADLDRPHRRLHTTTGPAGVGFGVGVASGAGVACASANSNRDAAWIIVPPAANFIVCARLCRISKRRAPLDGPLQLLHQGAHRQGRLLRARPVRQDHQPAVDPREAAHQEQGQDALAGHRGRPHAVLRLPADRARHHPRDEDAHPALHGARPGLLQRHPAHGAEGRRLRGVRGDSQEPMLDANMDALANLRENLEANEIDPTRSRRCSSTTSATCRTRCRRDPERTAEPEGLAALRGLRQGGARASRRRSRRDRAGVPLAARPSTALAATRARGPRRSRPRRPLRVRCRPLHRRRLRGRPPQLRRPRDPRRPLAGGSADELLDSLEMPSPDATRAASASAQDALDDLTPPSPPDELSLDSITTLPPPPRAAPASWTSSPTRCPSSSRSRRRRRPRPNRPRTSCPPWTTSSSRRHPSRIRPLRSWIWTGWETSLRPPSPRRHRRLRSRARPSLQPRYPCRCR
jgi:hypothetical protein